MDAYNALLSRASGVASTPYTPYTGELVAGVNQQQYSGINNINQNAGFAAPYIQQAATYANNAAQPLTAAQIQQYQNPYTQSVVNAAQGQFNLMNQQALNNIQGNAAMSGALGGDRAGVAKAAYYGAVLPGQEQQIAGLYNQSYNTGLQTAEQQQQNQANAAYSLGNLGVAGQNAALTGANAQIGAGSLEQGTQQALDAALLQQFQTAQAFPYQQTQWLAGIDTGVGSQMGGTSSTTAPAPNPFATIAGLGLTAAGAYFGGSAGAQAGAAAGQALQSSRRGGGIPGLAMGGVPYAGVGWVPSIQITPGRGAPPPPGTPQQQKQSGLGNQASGASAIGSGLWNKFNNQGISTDPIGSGLPLEGSPDANSLNYVVPMGGEGFGVGGVRTGGGIPGFADGGTSYDPPVSYQPDTVPLPPPKPVYRPATMLEQLQGVFMGQHVDDVVNNWGQPYQDRERDMRRRRGYADGGSPSFNEMWAADQGLGSPYPVSTAVPLPIARPDFDVDNPDSAYNRGLLPRQTVGYAGGDINASDIVLNAGPGGAGLGAPYYTDNAAQRADARIGEPTAYSDASYPSRRPNPLSSQDPEALGAYTNPAHAPLAYGPGYDRSGLGTNPAPSGAPTAPTGGLSGFLANLPGRGSLSPAASQALMAAGLGMMASRSPFLGVAIGEGGLQGLGAYNQQIQQEFSRKMQQEQKNLEERRVNIEADKLAQMVKQYQVPAGFRQVGEDSLEPIPGGIHDPAQIRAEAAAKRVPGMSDEALGTMVTAYRGGNTGVLTGISRGVSGPDNLNRFWNILSDQLKSEGASGNDLNVAKANFTAQSSAARTAANREAVVETAVNEAKGTFPLVLQRSAELPRTDFVPFNRLLEMGRTQTSNPAQGRLLVAMQGAITAYSQAMSRTGANTVHAQQHAEELLSSVTGPEDLQARIGQMEQELEIAKAAPEQTRQDILRRIFEGGRPTGGSAPGIGSAAGTAGGVASAPPASALKEGVHTKFRNGQTWTLQNGQPVQVQQ